MKVKITVGIIIAAGAVALFLLSSTGSSKAVYYYSPTQYLSDSSLRQDRVRLKGIIQPGSVKLSKERVDLWFTVADDTHAVPIHYRGAVPDAFQEGLEVVVDGRMRADGTFEGRELIVKCPSKYESGETGPGAKGPPSSA
jgi:cytochrome c-type biogenesis protein CcmE